MCHEKSIMSRAQSTPCVQHKQKSKMYKVQISIDGNSESVISWQDCTRTKQNDRWKLTRDKLTNERTDETRMQRWNYCTSKSIRSDDWNEEQKSRKQGWQDGNETQTSKEKLIEVGWSWVKSSEVEWSQVEYTAYKCAEAHRSWVKFSKFEWSRVKSSEVEWSILLINVRIGRYWQAVPERSLQRLSGGQCLQV